MEDTLPSEEDFSSETGEELVTRELFLRGSFWAVLGYAIGQGLRIGTNLLLTHLVAKEAFGLLALINVLLTGLQMFSDIGIGPCIIHNSRGDDQRFLNTAFTLQILRGAVLFLLGCLIAYPFSVFYREPALLLLIPVSACSVLFSDFKSTAIWTLTRHIQQGKVAAIRFLSDLAGSIVAVVWALYSPSVWALVGGILARSGVLAIASHFLLPQKNRIEWDWEDFRELYGYGRMIFLSTATYFLASQVERLILGKYLTARSEGMGLLGVFHIAHLLATLASMAVIEVSNRVLFPTVTKSMRTNRRTALRQFGKARMVLAGVAVSMAVVLILGGKTLVFYLLPENYKDAGWMLQILAILAVFNVSGTTIVSLLMADARLSYIVIANISRFLMVCSGLYVALSYFDIRTAIWVLAFSPLPAYLVYLQGLRKHFPEALSREIPYALGMFLTLGVCYWIAY